MNNRFTCSWIMKLKFAIFSEFVTIPKILKMVINHFLRHCDHNTNMSIEQPKQEIEVSKQPGQIFTLFMNVLPNIISYLWNSYGNNRTFHKNSSCFSKMINIQNSYHINFWNWFVFVLSQRKQRHWRRTSTQTSKNWEWNNQNRTVANNKRSNFCLVYVSFQFGNFFFNKEETTKFSVPTEEKKPSEEIQTTKEKNLSEVQEKTVTTTIQPSEVSKETKTEVPAEESGRIDSFFIVYTRL